MKLMFFLCKGVIMKICLYKMDVQSKLLPSTGTRVTATDVKYCVFVNKNKVLVVHCIVIVDKYFFKERSISTECIIILLNIEACGHFFPIMNERKHSIKHFLQILYLYL